jgi:transposase
MSGNKNLTCKTRPRIISQYEEGMTIAKHSQIFKTSKATIKRICKQYKEFGTIKTNHVGRNNRRTLPVEVQEFIQNVISENFSETLNSIKQKIFDNYGLIFSISTIFRALKQFNYTLKRVSLVPETRNSNEQIEKRFIYAR